MIFTGKIQNVTKDWKSGQLQITFSVNEQSVTSEVEKLKELDKLSVEAKKYREKRSLDANAYLWVLCTKIAEVVQSSKDEIYEEMLQKYGYLDTDEDGYIPMTLKSTTDISKIEGHWKFYKSNGKFSSYLKIKGSSDYDTAEMAKFLDSVVLEAKELDIPTETPDEIERMKALWQNTRAS